MDASRRAYLRLAPALAAGGVAGCLGSDDEDGQLTVTVRNQTDEAVPVTVTIADDEGQEWTSDGDVGAGVAAALVDDQYPPGRYTIEVRSDRWAASGLWDTETCTDYAFVATLSAGDDGPAVEASSTCEGGREGAT